MAKQRDILQLTRNHKGHLKGTTYTPEEADKLGLDREFLQPFDQDDPGSGKGKVTDRAVKQPPREN